MSTTASPNSEDVPSRLGTAEIRSLDLYWRTANYLSMGQIYTLGNALIGEPRKLEHIKPHLLGHWGTASLCPPQ